MQNYTKKIDASPKTGTYLEVGTTREWVFTWEIGASLSEPCSLNLFCTVFSVHLLYLLTVKKLTECGRQQHYLLLPHLHLQCHSVSLRFLTYFSVINPHVPGCTQPGLLYLPAICVHAAETAEQSEEDQECKSVG